MTNDLVITMTLKGSGEVEKAAALVERQLEEMTQGVEKSVPSFSKLQASLVSLDASLNIAGRGFDAFQSLAGATFDAIARGSEVDAVATAFDNLSGGAERAASKLEALQAGTKGLVSDFDLMQSANSAALLGLDFTDKQFEELSSAALKLGSAVGTDAVSSIESLITALGRNSPLILDNLGVTLKLSEAYEIYAAQLGKAVDKLTEAEKAEAFRAAAIEKIIQKNRELSDINETAGVAFERLQTTITNTYDEIATAVNENEALKNAFSELNTAIENVDWDPIIEGVADVIGALAEGSAAILKFIGDTASSFNGVVDLSNLQNLEQNFGKAGDEARLLAEQLLIIGRTQPFESAGENLDQMNVKLARLRELAEQNGIVVGASTKSILEELKKYNLSLVQQIELEEKGAKIRDKFTKVISKGEKETKDLTKATRDLKSEQKKFNDDLKFYVDDLDSVTEGFIKWAKETGNLEEELAGLSGGSLRDLERLIGDSSRQAFEAENAFLNLRNGLILVEQGVISLSELFDSLDFQKPVDGIDNLTEAQKRLNQEFNNLASFGIGTTFDFLEKGLSGDLFSGGQDTLDELEALGAGVGAIVGSIIDIYLGGSGAIGAQVGAGIGALLDDVAKPFRSNNRGAKARDEADKFFEDLIDQQRIRLNIRGAVQEFETLNEEIVQIFNETTGELEDQVAYEGFFESLNTSTEEGLQTFRGFEAVGIALNEMFHTLGLDAAQFGNILGNNLGPNLNNLQILLQTMGFTAEELKEQITNAWLSGEIGAGEALQATAQVEDIFAQGIPGAIGKFDQAFQNLIDSAGVGRLVLDSLGDIAVEAQEAGISTLDELRQQLLDSGADAEKVEQLFQAISDAGITSLEQLADISVQTAQVISSNLEGIPDFYNDAAQSIDELQSKLDQIQSKEVDITYNIRTNVDENTEKYRETLESNGTYVPSEAQGN